MAKNKHKTFTPASIIRPHESALDSISNKVKEKGADYNDIAEASRILPTILSEKEIGELFKAIKRGNDSIKGLNDSVKKSNGKVIAAVEGNIFGIITEGKLRDILRKQQEEQIAEDGPLYVVSESIKTVNDNLSTTARILKAILQLQMITIAGVLKNAQVETRRAEKLEMLSQRLLNSDLELKDLLDYSLELDDYVRDTDVKLIDIKSNLDDVWKEINIIHSSLISVAEEAEQKITNRIAETENSFNQKITEAEGQLSKDIQGVQKSTGNVAKELTEAKNQFAEGIKGAKESADRLAKDLAEAKGRLSKDIQGVQESTGRVAKELTEAKGQFNHGLESANEATAKVVESLKHNQENIQITNQLIKNRIMIAYIIGGLGVICSIATLVLAILDVV